MFLTRTANLLYDGLLTLVYPHPCQVCGGIVEARRLGVACARCWEETRLFTCGDTVCWKCGTPAIGTTAFEKRDQVRCRVCEDDYFTAARACGAYEGALRASVLALKRAPYFSPFMMALLLKAREQAPLNAATLVIPVPLHPQREKARGYNQAAVLGYELARLARLPFDDLSLERIVHSERHRAGLDARGRRETVEKAFAVRRPRLIEGEHVLLVDDVFTTGSTASSCAAALMAGGAKEVCVLTVARTLPARVISSV